MNPGFDLLLDEPPLLVINKPGGLLTQAPAGIDSVEWRLKRLLAERRISDPSSASPHSFAANPPAPGDRREPSPPYLGIPHRLDRPASGAMVFATTHRAANRLSQQFENRAVRKTYWALVEGEVLPEQGTWRDFIRKIPDVAQAELVPPNHPEGREAILHYRRLNFSANGISWLEIELETGRMHQIRLQAGARNHAVLGDSQYGSTRTFGPVDNDPRLLWIALHARQLQFRGQAGAMLLITAPLSNWWNDYVPAIEFR